MGRVKIKNAKRGSDDANNVLPNLGLINNPSIEVKSFFVVFSLRQQPQVSELNIVDWQAVPSSA